jgi:hypothetical protein
MFMDQTVSERPTSGASAAELAAQLHEVRARTHRLTDDLSSDQLMGVKLDIVNPVLWEIGHVGWFHEYWTLRHSLGQRPLIERADDLWNSSTRTTRAGVSTCAIATPPLPIWQMFWNGNAIISRAAMFWSTFTISTSWQSATRICTSKP